MTVREMIKDRNILTKEEYDNFMIEMKRGRNARSWKTQFGDASTCALLNINIRFDEPDYEHEKDNFIIDGIYFGDVILVFSDHSDKYSNIRSHDWSSISTKVYNKFVKKYLQFV